ncbi:TPA: hypothetical protein MAD57_006038 [Klebsiella variicola subsp. variicola]|nr:hypothetical protein [Escherichia coli]HBS2261160.1 hypothetical protein [Klebsiella variicola subsp. variicola]HBS2266295.1 hypothetical protein [Klebsiella variicola subsp. variicola]
MTFLPHVQAMAPGRQRRPGKVTDGVGLSGKHAASQQDRAFSTRGHPRRDRFDGGIPGYLSTRYANSWRHPRCGRTS